jgi:hypothetical protein
MSLYINHENQRILWESIQQHPSIYIIPQEQRNHWFKNIVKNVYDNIPKPWFQRKITTEELNYLNQSTVRHMLGDLKPPPVANLPPRADISPPLSNQYQQDAYTSFPAAAPSYNEESMDVGIKSAHTPMIQQRYLEKQRELESMLRQPNPTTTVDFKMSTLDEPITNMEELLKKHAREREQDLVLDPNSSGNLATFRVSSEEATRNVGPLSNTPVAITTNNLRINITEEPVTIAIIDVNTDIPVNTPLNILNGTPSGVPLDVSRATLPINQLKSTVIFDDSSNSNVHRCKKANSVKKHISFQEDYDKGLLETETSQTSHQISDFVLLEQKVLKMEQEMEMMKKMIFEIHKNTSINSSSSQILLLENS